MSTTEELIRHLAAEVKPVRRGTGLRRLVTGILLGAVVALAGMIASLGLPLQSIEATGAAAFAMKLLFSATLFAASFGLLFIAARPGRTIGSRWVLLLTAPALVAVAAVMELSVSPAADRQQLWFGSTWQTCLLAIGVFSLPMFAGVLWALQTLAPTRLRLAGLLAGLTAGSAAATLYALYCPETAAIFLLSWYSLGIFGAGLIGALVGPRFLRW